MRKFAMLTTSKIVIIGLCLALGLLVMRSAPAESKDPPKPNVIMIVMGTFRADHMGCYGYQKNTTPNLDKFAKECLFFRNAYSQSHWTLPSHCSILTSRYPSVHGVMERGSKLDPAEVTLPETLKNYDFQTAAFTGGLDMKKEHGLDQGFDAYYDDAGEKILGTSDTIFPKAINWLKSAKKDKPFFLYIHTYDTHLPYAPPAPYNTIFASKDYQGQFKGKELTYEYLKTITGPLPQADIDYVVSQYDGEVAYQDMQFGLFMDAIKKTGLYDNTIIVVTADHGEPLYDHNTWDRFGSQDLYNGVIKVPLMMKCLDKDFYTYPADVQLIDIMPMILGRLGIPLNHGAQGIDALAKKPVRDYIIAESSLTRQSFKKGQWKLIAASSSYELYNLDKDPKEMVNLAPKNPDKVYEMTRELMGVLKSIRVERREPPKIILSPQMIEELRKSGYWEKEDDE